MSHAVLSPSAASRWLVCTPAPRLEEHEPDTTSPYAEEGTFAHEVAAHRLEGGRYTKAQKASPHYTQELVDAVELYVDLVRTRYNEARRKTEGAVLYVEQALDLTDYIPEGFGTADAVVIADDLMEVVDFKFGKGVPVAAEENKQMMIYALGALSAFGFIYDIRDVRMTIVQPRIGNVSEWTVPAEQLRTWATDVLRPKAALAFKGEGEQVPGDHCRFCRVKGKCRALAETGAKAAAVSARLNHDPRLLTDSELAGVLCHATLLKDWLTAVEDYGLQHALEGYAVPGFKVVEGRSTRFISSDIKARDALLRQGIPLDQINRPCELRSLTELEKLHGAQRIQQVLGPLIQKPRGKPTLVAESDKRPPYSSAAADFDGVTPESDFK